MADFTPMLDPLSATTARQIAEEQLLREREHWHWARYEQACPYPTRPTIQIEHRHDFGGIDVSWRLGRLDGRFHVTDEVLYQVNDSDRMEQLVMDQIWSEIYAAESSEFYQRREENGLPPPEPPSRHIIWARDIAQIDHRMAVERVYGTAPGSEPMIPSPKAETKARELLMRFLNPQQLETFASKNYFDVAVTDGTKHRGTYRVSSKRTYNVKHLGSGVHYCAGPVDGSRLPICDVLLAQKVMLESAPEEFFAKANDNIGGGLYSNFVRNSNNFGWNVGAALTV